jgi:hypothetical protein
MRSYNFVVDITPDIEDFQYRIRAIDFDQQSYEGRKNLYLPQFFKENYAFVDLSLKHLNKDSIVQYQTEERTLMAFRLASARYRIKELLDIMSKEIFQPRKIRAVKNRVGPILPTTYHIQKCNSMGQIVKLNLKQVLRKNLCPFPNFKVVRIDFIPRERRRREKNFLCAAYSMTIKYIFSLHVHFLTKLEKIQIIRNIHGIRAIRGQYFNYSQAKYRKS